MKRNDYKRPTMKVVMLQHRCHILAGSDPIPGAKKQDYESYEW